MVLCFATLYFTGMLHFTKAEAGVIMSCFGIGSIIGSYVGGWLADRYNIKSIMLFALVASGCILLCIHFTTHKYVLMVIIFLYALTADMFRPASAIAITNASPAADRTRSISMMRLCINLGFSIGPAIGGIIAFKYGYHFLFTIDAATSFAAAVVLFLYYPNIKTATNKASNMAQLDNSTSAYKDTKYLIFIFFVALYGLCFFQIFASVPTYFKQVWHYSEDTIGYLLGLNGALVVLVEMPLVAYLQKHKSVNIYVAIGCINIVIALGILYFTNGSYVLAIVYTLFMTLSEIFAMPFMMNYALSRPPVPQRQGQYSALYSIGYGVSLILAPSVGLYIAQHFGFQTMFALFISVSAIIAVAFFKLIKQ
jgi:predicted MFS family arabinose efflux permease